MTDPVDLPDDIEALKALVVAAEAKARIAQAEAAREKALASARDALIAHQKLVIAKLRNEKYGTRSERSKLLVEQMEFELEDLEATAREDELAAEIAAIKAATTFVPGYTRKKHARKPFPEHLPRERVVVPAPTTCKCCGSEKLVKMGEDVTETLEVIPRKWKVIQTVREKFSCRMCEKISQPAAPFHAIARGHSGPNLLAMVLANKFAMHQPLNRQSERYAREGIDLPPSTLADEVGACAVALAPIADLIRDHVFRGERVHGDDTNVPLLTKGKTTKAHLWTYVRDDKPFGGTAPPAAVFYFSRDWRGEHPQRHLANYGGILQADKYHGFKALYKDERLPAPITEAACWSHGRRKFFALADLEGKLHQRRDQKNKSKMPVVISPIALETVRKIDAIFDLERVINGQPADVRLSFRQKFTKQLVEDLEVWMRGQSEDVSVHNDLAAAFDYMLDSWEAFTRFLGDGRICLTNNAAERALRSIALGRKAWLFAGSERGGERAALMYTLVQTAKLNDVDPTAWLAHVLARIADHPMPDLEELLPWNWINPVRHCRAA